MKQITIKGTINLISGNWEKFGLILVFDVLFVLSLLILKFLLANFNRWFIGLASGLGWGVRIAYLFLLVLMLAIFIMAYSFFKYIILDTMRGIFSRKDADFGRFWPFLKANLAILAPIAAISFIFLLSAFSYLGDIALAGEKPKFIAVFLGSTVIGLVWIVYSYTLLNLLHFIWLRKNSEKAGKMEKSGKTAKEAFAASLKAGSYRLYWADFKILLVSGIFILAIHLLAKIFVFSDMTAYLRYGGYYKMLLESLLVIVFYFVVLFNRVNFYSIYSKAKAI